MTEWRIYKNVRLGWAAFLAVWLAGAAWGQLPKLELPGLKKAGEEEGRHVKVEVVPQYEAVHDGQRFLLAVVLEVQKGWHLYANPRQGELGMDTEIVPEKSEVLRFGRVRYPEGEKYEDKVLQSSYYKYEGKVVCFVPVEIVTEKPMEVPITLGLKGLLCSETGTCLPWEEKVAATIKIANISMVGAMNRPELFTGLDLGTFDWTEAESGPEPVTGKMVAAGGRAK